MVMQRNWTELNAEEKEREDARDFMKGELIEIWSQG